MRTKFIRLFYILFCLQKENHGYGITQKVKEMTDSQVSISPGTMYGTLSKMEKEWEEVWQLLKSYLQKQV